MNRARKPEPTSNDSTGGRGASSLSTWTTEQGRYAHEMIFELLEESRNSSTIERSLHMKFLSVVLIIVLGSRGSLFAQQSGDKTRAAREAIMTAEPQTFPLWENGAPGALGNSESDQPTLTYYPPVYPTGTAVVIAPGGGYVFVAT